MKFLFTLIICFFFYTSSAQIVVMAQWSGKVFSPEDDTTYYSPGQKLAWADFKGKPGQPFNALAVTASGFGYDALMRRTNNTGSVYITVFCYFSKKDSWVRKGRESAYALNHEQHHFDIAYIAARNFLDSLQHTSMTLQNYSEIIQRMYNNCYKNMQLMQNDYDGETHNGLIIEAQEKWNEKINALLKLREQNSIE